MNYQNSLEYAQDLDKDDPIKDLRNEYHLIENDGGEAIYFCGNSLGLQPKVTKDFVDQELDKWRELGVEGHFSKNDPWVSYHQKFKQPLAKLVGAEVSEVTCMNNLTTNLHLLIASFYRPEGKRKKVIIESGAFPSDHYAAESHMRHLGIDPEENLILLKPGSDQIFSTKEINDKILEIGDELALVLWPGIQYYTGQFFDLKAISEAAHNAGAFVGFDLAHAIGNVPLNLSQDNADFATWCSYKYVNSGPGGISGIFVNKKYAMDATFHKLTGWWGHDLKTRFEMDNKFKAAEGADSWMLSNSNIISASAHLAALSVFEKTSITELREKSIRLTGFLEFLLTSDSEVNTHIELLTPSEIDERGCQLSIFVSSNGKAIHQGLIDAGVILDWREPNVIRVAPTPMYNTFGEVFQFYQIFKKLIVKHAS